MADSNTGEDKIIQALSIDTVVFGFENAELYVLLIKRGPGPAEGEWALPGGYIRYSESVDAAAYRILTDLTAVSDIYLEELKTFGEVDRYPGARVITVAYYALVNKEAFFIERGDGVAEVRWFKIHNMPKSMVFDHREIFDFAFKRLKHRVQHEPIGFSLLPVKFTLLQIKQLYDCILERELDKSNFRKKLIRMNLLIPCDEKQKDVAHRAARLYRFDEEVYNELLKKGFVFEL